MGRFTTFLLCAMLLLAIGIQAHDDCAAPGEMRRHHNCAAVKHTKKDVCCWAKRDGTHGLLPYSCCGTGWHTHGCEAEIDRICDMHTDEH